MHQWSMLRVLVKSGWTFHQCLNTPSFISTLKTVIDDDNDDDDGGDDDDFGFKVICIQSYLIEATLTFTNKLN